MKYNREQQMKQNKSHKQCHWTYDKGGIMDQ